MQKSNPQAIKVEEDSTSWYDSEQIEYDTDHSAAVVVVESETITRIFAYMKERGNRLGVPDEFADAVWKASMTRLLTMILNDTLSGGEGRINNCLGLDPEWMSALMDDIKDGLEAVPMFFEDIIGFSITPGTSKIIVHFAQEGLNNGGIAA